MQWVIINAVDKIGDMGYSNSRVERLLQELIRKSVKVNTKRKLWGLIPHSAADCMHTLFPAYPEPQRDYHTNALVDPQDFLGKKTPRGSRNR